ncbi:homoserine O-acetyltransferase isoform 4, partial [Tanacetum coccineum]
MAAVLSTKTTTTVQTIDLYKQPNSRFLKGCPLLHSFSLNIKPVCSNKARIFPSLVVSASSAKTTTTTSGGTLYVNITGFPFPLGPFLNRSTIRTEVVKDCIWLFEQEQALGFSSVSTNTRMTVIKLKSGGLWVHAPIAPTK